MTRAPADEPLLTFTAHRLERADLHALMARSDGPALWRTAWHFGALAVTGTLVWRFRATSWLPPFIVAHGYALAFLFCAFHEMAHRTAFRMRWLNALVGTVAGLLIVWPYRNYRVFHWEHHRHTQDVARDPELFFAKPASVGAYLFALTGIPYLENTRTTLTIALVRLFAWNMPYHAEHHAYPAVPFHALPRLHERVRAEIANLEPGYVAATAKVNRYLWSGQAAGTTGATN